MIEDCYPSQFAMEGLASRRGPFENEYTPHQLIPLRFHNDPAGGKIFHRNLRWIMASIMLSMIEELVHDDVIDWATLFLFVSPCLRVE